MRVFVAIDLPYNIKNTTRLLIEQLQSKDKSIKFAKIENLHITLKFLGELTNDNIVHIENFLNKIASKNKAFEINLKESGVFKSLKNPRILWIGQNHNADFENITSNIDELFAKEDHICHITLARLKNIPIQKIKELLELTNFFIQNNHLQFRVEEFFLYESILKSSAPIYKQIKKFKLQI
ncbi:2'-5' RNA ligase [Desulfurella amilsii]|uniref:RNA 2',3'-cyclic phosphodiesterase n=1 Tax=Desulfurella amilsii TaxID=1562698 RepID=A0A1X4XWJ4_9BACT|nr:RNA 2',3'-cyclic phosphodiesterase [Desulfurella amilsii]OSS41909.1 2'-5' RNA ligase [Desulfurella amilsii]